MTIDEQCLPGVDCDDCESQDVCSEVELWIGEQIQNDAAKGDREVKRWTIVAFDHPKNGRSILYKQNLTLVKLMEAVSKAADSGANLMSIRGVEVAEK